MSESGNWFSHDANNEYNEPTKSPRCRTEAARASYEKSQGTMGSVMNHDQNRDQTMTPIKNGNYAREVAKKNVQGIMMKYLKEDENRDYSSPRPNARVKFEAEDNFEKNKGNMNDFMTGYPDVPAKHNNRRVKPEGAENAARNKGTLDQLMNNYGNMPPQQLGQAPRVKPEALGYAERNKGTLGLLGDFDNLQVHG